jgi:hypothetical protein
VYFYELHEGDNDVFADLLLAHEDEMEPEEFLRTVQTVREHVIGSYHHDTLIEAIAEELERDHGFVAVSDDRLSASVNVSKIDDDNYLAELDPDEEDEDLPDYRGIFVELPRDNARPN